MIDLVSLRKTRLLKVPKNLSEQILKHPGARSIAIYLELKPLFVSGVIHNNDGNIPYASMAKFVGYSNSGFRKHFSVLRDLGLVRIDAKRNVHFAKYKYLQSLFEHGKKTKTYKLLNEYDVYHLLKTLAIHENLKKQQYAYKHKLARKLAIDTLANLKTGPYSIKGTCEGLKEIGFHNAFNDFITTNETNAYIDSVSEKFMSKVDRKHDLLTDAERQFYKSQYLWKEPNSFDPNPFISVSCKKTAELLNRKSASTGCYQQKILEELKMISIHRESIKTSSEGAYFAAAYGQRSNIVNSKGFDKAKSLTRVKNRKFLYRSVVTFPNQLQVNVL